MATPLYVKIPKSAHDSFTSGNMPAGMSSSCNMRLSHCKDLMLYNMVREALVTSVTCDFRFVMFQISQVSIVPNSNSPREAFSLACGTLSSIHFIFVAEKYESITKPVCSRTYVPSPIETISSQMEAVRLSCHTMALYTG